MLSVAQLAAATRSWQDNRSARVTTAPLLTPRRTAQCQTGEAASGLRCAAPAPNGAPLLPLNSTTGSRRQHHRPVAPHCRHTSAQSPLRTSRLPMYNDVLNGCSHWR